MFRKTSAVFYDSIKLIEWLFRAVSINELAKLSYAEKMRGKIIPIDVHFTSLYFFICVGLVNEIMPKGSRSTATRPLINNHSFLFRSVCISVNWKLKKKNANANEAHSLNSKNFIDIQKYYICSFLSVRVLLFKFLNFEILFDSYYAF